MEHDVLAFWEDDKTFARSLDIAGDRPRWTFYEGPPDGQRTPRHPPRRGPRLQGRLPTVQDDAGLPGGPQGRLGLPRPARRARRREGARLLRQGRHRGLRRRGVQREVPRVGAAARRRLRGDVGPDGLLGRHRRPLRHDDARLRPVGVVGPQADPRQGPAGRGLPRLAVLPAVRHRTLRPRARPGLRDRHRPVGLCPLPAHVGSLRRHSGEPRGRAARLDDDAVDAGLQHRGRGEPGCRLCRGDQRRGEPGGRRAPLRRGAG